MSIILKDIKGTIRYPIKTFKEITEREINLKRPFLIVLVLGILTILVTWALLTKMIFSIPEEVKGLLTFGFILGVIFTFIGIFVMWAIQAGILHLFAFGLFKGEGNYKKLLELIGYAYFPQIFAITINLIIVLFFMPKIHISMTIPPEQQILVIKEFQYTKIIGLVGTAWTLLLSVIAVKEVHKLTLLKALIVVLVPTIIYFILTQYVFHIGVI